MGSGEKFFICSIYLSNDITTLILYFSQVVIDFYLYTEFLLLLMVCLGKGVFLLCFLSWCYITNRLHKVKSLLAGSATVGSYGFVPCVFGYCIWKLYVGKTWPLIYIFSFIFYQIKQAFRNYLRFWNLSGSQRR